MDIFDFGTDNDYNIMDIDDAERAESSGISNKVGTRSTGLVRSGEQGDGKVEKGDTQKQVTATIYVQSLTGSLQLTNVMTKCPAAPT